MIKSDSTNDTRVDAMENSGHVKGKYGGTPAGFKVYGDMSASRGTVRKKKSAKKMSGKSRMRY